MTQPGSSKSEVAAYMAEHPHASPREVQQALAAQGLQVSLALVYKVQHEAAQRRAEKTKKKRKKVQRRRGVRTVRRAAPAPTASSLATISPSVLLAAKQLADRLGGVERAKAALDALEQLKLQ